MLKLKILCRIWKYVKISNKLSVFCFDNFIIFPIEDAFNFFDLVKTICFDNLGKF